MREEQEGEGRSAIENTETDEDATDEDEMEGDGTMAVVKRVDAAIGSGGGGGAVAACGGRAAPAAEWQVNLGRSFKAYESAAVQSAIEAAWQADKAETEVTVRGSTYLIKFGSMVQQVKDDPSRWRSVRRHIS